MKTLFILLCMPIFLGDGDAFDPKAIHDAQERLAAKTATQPTEADRLRKENAELKASIITLQMEIGRLRGKPGIEDAHGKENASIQIKLKAINVVGERYDGRKISVLGCNFRSADNTWISTFPIEDDDKWLGIYVRQDGEFFQFLIAEKTKWADFILSLKDNEAIDIRGQVVRLSKNGWHGIICDQIERSPKAK